MLTTAVGAVTYATTDRATLRRLGAQVVLIDLTATFYHYRDVPTVDKWARAVVHDELGRWANDRQLRLLVLVADAGRVPQKALTDAARGHGVESATPPDIIINGATALPERAAFTAWVGNKSVQAGLWQVLGEAVRGWHEECAPAATVILDGPGLDGQHAPPVGLPPARCAPSAARMLVTATSNLCVLPCAHISNPNPTGTLLTRTDRAVGQAQHNRRG